jgi:Na+/melibiose symporter-like transporter
MAMFGVMFLIMQYFQLILGYTPLGSALRFLPMAPIMLVVAPMTPKLCDRFGANRTVAFGMSLIGIGLIMFRGVSATTSYPYIFMSIVPLVSGMALAMSPMTAAIMSAVPPRRAGAGSAMNDATRELGAALGVAVMGSIAASGYASGVNALTTSLPPAAQNQASSSIAGALQVAAQLPSEAGRTLTQGAEAAFIDGIHLSVTVGALLAWTAAFLVYRYLPHRLAHEGAMQGAVGSVEDAAELGIAGVLPVFADEVFPNDLPPDVSAAGEVAT